jgi:iron complex transport system substrate-binding protein
MRRRSLPFIACLLLAASLSLGGGGCADTSPAHSEKREEIDVVALLSGEGFPVEIVDDAGRTVLFEAAPKRILSLVPSATEVLLALGVEGLLVGRTEYDLDPRMSSLPSVGGGLEPSLETIVALTPDLVIHFMAESDLGTPRILDSAHIPRLVVRPDDIGDIRRIVAILGRSVGRRIEAAELIDRVDRELSEVAETVRLAPKRRSAFLLGGDPPVVAGSGTYLHELIEVAGGENVFADIGDLYAPVSLETFVRRRVEAILVLGEAGVPDALAGIPVHVVPAQLPGLSVGIYARDIARIFHPELFR